jgi:hypothetical protein
MANYLGSELINLPPDQESGVYKKPIYYGLIHVASGFLAFHYAWFGIVFLIYQLSQLFLNKRFFIFQPICFYIQKILKKLNHQYMLKIIT